MKRTIKMCGIIAMVAIIGFSMTACDSDSGGGGGNRDSRLVLPDGYAWVDDFVGYIFKADGSCQQITKDGGGNWSVQLSGTWSSRDNNEFEIIWETAGVFSRSYTVTSDTLTFIPSNSVWTRTAVTLP